MKIFFSELITNKVTNLCSVLSIFFTPSRSSESSMFLFKAIYRYRWLSARAVETHFKKPRFFRFFKKPKNPEKLGF